MDEEVFESTGSAADVAAHSPHAAAPVGGYMADLQAMKDKLVLLQGREHARVVEERLRSWLRAAQ